MPFFKFPQWNHLEGILSEIQFELFEWQVTAFFQCFFVVRKNPNAHGHKKSKENEQRNDRKYFDPSYGFQIVFDEF